MKLFENIEAVINIELFSINQYGGTVFLSVILMAMTVFAVLNLPWKKEDLECAKNELCLILRSLSRKIIWLQGTLKCVSDHPLE